MTWPGTAQRRLDFVTGIVIALIGAVYYIATFWIQTTSNIVTPATFPAIVGIALFVLGAVLVVQSMIRRNRDTPAEADDSSTSAGEGTLLEASAEPKSKKVVLHFVLFFVYLAILIPVGFLLSTAGFLMAITSIYAPEKWIRNLIYCVVFAVVVYIAFVYGLAVYLPVGILG